MIHQEKISALLQQLVDTPGWKFAIGVRIRFNHPMVLYQTYPQPWLEYYEANGLVHHDPTIKWGMTHNGTCAWSDLTGMDSNDIFGQSAKFGLSYGLVVSIGPASARTLGFFARADREFNDEERAFAEKVSQELHELTGEILDQGKELPPELQALPQPQGAGT